MKRWVIFSIIILWIFSVPAFAAELPHIDGEPFFNDTAKALSTGEFTLNPIELFNRLSENVVYELKNEAHFLLTLIIIAITSSVTNVLANSFGEKTSGEAAFFAVFALMSAIALKCFSIALEYTGEVVGHMCDFITKLSPAVMITLALCGKTASAAAFQPVLSATVYVVSLFIEKALLPLSVFGAMLSVSSNISENVRLSGFTRVINSVSKWVMAAIITIFTGVNAIYGFNAPALDAMSAKAVKFAIGTLVPVVGGFLSDTLEAVISGAKMMKNAAGTAGIVTLVTICAIPIIKIGVISLMLRITAAVCEPVTDRRISQMLSQISASVMTLFAVVIMVTVLFIINIAMIISFT